MMTTKADREWWQTIFDEVYLVTDARSVCDEEVTRREVDLVCELLPMSAGHKILDLCGGHGRHSLELSARGFTGCTVLDYSEFLINHARKRAAECQSPVACVRANARSLGVSSERFDHVLIMGNSLGYISESQADREIVAEAKRVLRSGGWLLVDAADGAAVKDSFIPTAWHEIGADTVVCRQRRLEGNTLYSREMVLSKREGLIRDCTYGIRLYDARSVHELFEEVGFRRVEVHTDFSPQRHEGDYGFMNHRMIATGQKPPIP
jgi:D-alanine-D-alanine ligase